MAIAPEVDLSRDREPRRIKGEIFGGMAVVGAGVESDLPPRDELAEYMARVVRSAADPEE